MMKMSDFDFLKYEELNKLEILKKRGNKAAITDFSILLGGFVGDSRVKNDDSLAGRTGVYWTKTPGDGTVKVVLDTGNTFLTDTQKRIVGARLVYRVRDTRILENIKEASDGVPEKIYGYYPQQAPSKNMQKTLNSIFFKKYSLNYIIDSRKSDEEDKEFLEEKIKGIEYKGKFYVRVKANPRDREKPFILSNGEEYIEGDYVWVEVQPIKWLYDQKEEIMITEKIIFAGVQFSQKKYYHSRDFWITNIKKFINNLEEEIVQPIEEKTINLSNEKKNENLYNFDFSEVSNEDIIKGAIEANVAIFLHGKIGSGKSDRVEELDPDFTELNLSHLDPELLDGLAGEKDGKAVHIKPPWLEEIEEKCEKEPNKIHILFLEELTNASKTMQSKAYGIALGKKVAGRWKLPENVRVVAAGNELEDSIIANEMAEPLYDRFAHVYIETNSDNWLEWAVTPESTYERLDYKKIDSSRPKIHPAIYAYVSAKGDKVLRTKYNKEKPEPYANPRRWEMASDMLYATNNPSTLRAIVGEDLTRDFISFCQRPLLTIEDVLNKNYIEEDLEEMDIGRKLATVAGLVSVESKDMPKIREFTKKLGAEFCKKFEAQWTHGDLERLEQLNEILMEEKEEETYNEHLSDEARDAVDAGILAFEKINGSYQEYLLKEKNKGDENKDK